MATINVKKPFIHNTPAGHVPYVPGLIDVPDEVANHWYVREHSDIVEVEQYRPKTQEHGPLKKRSRHLRPWRIAALAGK